MGISDPLNSPIYSGASLTSDVPHTGPVAIAGHVYQLEPTKCSRKTLDALRPGSDIQARPGEQSFNNNGLWPRTLKRFELGAGQKFWDDVDSVDNRFFESKGIDPWTSHEFSMLPATTQLLASVNTNLQLVQSGVYVFVADGSTLRWSTNGTTFPNSTAALAAITSLATDGSRIYVATGSTLQRATFGAALANFGTFTADLVGYGNGRLLAADANRLVELDAAGAVGTLDYSHPNTNFAWQGIVATAGAIYAWGAAGGVSEVYVITVDDTDGSLKIPVSAWNVPVGITVNTMCWASSVMLIGTTIGFALATIGSDNHLANGAFIPVAAGVTAMAVRQNYVWFSWANYDGVSTGLGRADLANMVDTNALVPAYASDLMVTGAGAIKGLVAAYGDSRIFTVSGLGVYGQSANKVATAELKAGWIDFSTVERKVSVSLEIRHEALAGQIALAIDLDEEEDDGGQRMQVSTISLAGTTGTTVPYDTAKVPFYRAMPIIILTRSATDATQGPVVRHVTFRAIPVPRRTDEIILAIRMKTTVSTTVPYGTSGKMSYNPREEFTYLKGIESEGTIVRYQEGRESIDVIIDGIQLNPDGWSTDGDFFESIMGVRMLTMSAVG